MSDCPLPRVPLLPYAPSAASRDVASSRRCERTATERKFMADPSRGAAPRVCTYNSVIFPDALVHYCLHPRWRTVDALPLGELTYLLRSHYSRRALQSTKINGHPSFLSVSPESFQRQTQYFTMRDIPPKMNQFRS